MWKELREAELLLQIIEESKIFPVLIFKHSTRCSTSALALNRLERNWNVDETKNLKRYFLDVIGSRAVSNEVEEYFNVRHQTPQILVIKEGICVYHQSHMGIDYKTLIKLVEELSVN